MVVIYSSRQKVKNDSTMSAEKTEAVLMMKLANKSDQLFFLDKSTGRFKLFESPMLSQQLVIFVDENGIVTVRAVNDTRFSILFAFFKNAAWRTRARLVRTTDRGAICFPMFKTFEHTANGIYDLPDAASNTIVVFGVHTNTTTSKVCVKSIDDGRVTLGHFIFNRTSDDITISDSMTTNSRRTIQVSVASKLRLNIEFSIEFHIDRTN